MSGKTMAVAFRYRLSKSGNLDWFRVVCLHDRNSGSVCRTLCAITREMPFVAIKQPLPEDQKVPSGLARTQEGIVRI
jgi:hypothetical protein